MLKSLFFETRPSARDCDMWLNDGSFGSVYVAPTCARIVRLKHARTCCQLAPTLEPSESKSHCVALGDVQPLPGNNSLHLGD